MLFHTVNSGLNFTLDNDFLAFWNRKVRLCRNLAQNFPWIAINSALINATQEVFGKKITSIVNIGFSLYPAAIERINHDFWLLLLNGFLSHFFLFFQDTNMQMKLKYTNKVNKYLQLWCAWNNIYMYFFLMTRQCVKGVRSNLLESAETLCFICTHSISEKATLYEGCPFTRHTVYVLVVGTVTCTSTPSTTVLCIYVFVVS